VETRFEKLKARYQKSVHEMGYFRPLAAIVLGLLIVQCLRLIYVIITPTTPLGTPDSIGPAAISSESQLALFRSFDPFYRSVPATGGEAEVTSLQLTLYGIRVNEASGLGSAIIAGPDGVQNSIQVGQEVQQGVVLDSVAFDHIVLLRNGVRESLFLDQSIPAETVGESSPPASTAPSTQAPGGPNPTMSSDNLQNAISFAPRTDSGKVTGIVVASKGNDTAFKAAGFKDGDVVTSVNGSPVRTQSDVKMLLDQLQPGARVSLMVERGGQSLPIAINLDKQ
jgi:general secretion pathway protein C